MTAASADHGERAPRRRDVSADGGRPLDWRFGESTSFLLGCRALGLDRLKGVAQADIILHGPVLGFIRRFQQRYRRRKSGVEPEDPAHLLDGVRVLLAGV